LHVYADIKVIVSKVWYIFGQFLIIIEISLNIVFNCTATDARMETHSGLSEKYLTVYETIKSSGAVITGTAVIKIAF
jgi:hypothetical protein